MLNFIVLTLSITVGILLASAVSIFIIMQPKVIGWYMNWVYKTTMKSLDNIPELADVEKPEDL